MTPRPSAPITSRRRAKESTTQTSCWAPPCRARQGELIDKVYAFGAGGATDNAGTGAITRELEFVLPPIAGTTNAASHRNMENIVDLQLAINNSNVAGVSGDGPYETPTTGDPQNVTTGIEFSIPLCEIGYTSGADQAVGVRQQRRARFPGEPDRRGPGSSSETWRILDAGL